MVSLPLIGLEVPNRIGQQLRGSLSLRIDLDAYTGDWSLHIGPPTTDRTRDQALAWRRALTVGP